MFKSQFRLMLEKKGFQVAFTIMICIAVFAPVYHIIYNITQDNDISNITSPRFAFLLNEMSYTFTSYIDYLIPILTVFVFSYTYLTDRKLNYDSILISKVGIKKYYYSKAFICLIGGFLLFFIPMVLNLAVSYLFLPDTKFVRNMSEIDEMVFAISDINFINFDDTNYAILYIYIYHPIISGVIVSAICGLTAAVSSLVSYVTTLFIKKYAYYSALPMLIVFLSTAWLDDYIITYGNPAGTILFGISKYMIAGLGINSPYTYFFGLCAALIIISFILIKVKSDRDQLG